MVRPGVDYRQCDCALNGERCIRIRSHYGVHMLMDGSKHEHLKKHPGLTKAERKMKEEMTMANTSRTRKVSKVKASRHLRLKLKAKEPRSRPIKDQQSIITTMVAVDEDYYISYNGGWTRDLAYAKRFRDPAEADAAVVAELARAPHRDSRVVEVTVIYTVREESKRRDNAEVER